MGGCRIRQLDSPTKHNEVAGSVATSNHLFLSRPDSHARSLTASSTLSPPLQQAMFAQPRPTTSPTGSNTPSSSSSLARLVGLTSSQTSDMDLVASPVPMLLDAVPLFESPMTALAKDLERGLKTTTPGPFLRTRQPSDDDSETELRDGSPPSRVLGDAMENPFLTKPPKFPLALDMATAPRMPRRSKLRDSGICLEDDEGVFGFVGGGVAIGPAGRSHWASKDRQRPASARPGFARQSSEPTLFRRKRQLQVSPSTQDPMNSDGAVSDACTGRGPTSGELPPQKMRRTQSCYSGLPRPSTVEAECAKVYGHEGSLLPCFPGKSDAHKRISGEMLVRLINGEYAHAVDEYHIIDCRFPYEYAGGHIENALNVNTKEDLQRLFFSPPTENKRTVIVFHCEFSSHRAPRMASFMRTQDRELNMQEYPKLFYPEIYILQGGYKEFFNEYKTRCLPQRYVEMCDASHTETLKLSMRNYRKEFGRSASESCLRSFGACK
ncbi:Rhodanese-like domain-containing protein [Fimicolochytrium jonesii]|uniref:Rhodanese-like domain-containing protein n=1 Tax=Fimicolochytrium jonesii TaxID=1396493 RepID=UPI0022FDB6C7|nr:Rhodanese-like domain-containing protein [Fimicolochytrium jonesii]KAI8815732.1 Rhodanese-like domain-containing protein [Fimicolochytrium jonesii]